MSCEQSCSICGHLREEHANSFLEECEAEGCTCEIFDPCDHEEEE